MTRNDQVHGRMRKRAVRCLLGWIFCGVGVLIAAIPAFDEANNIKERVAPVVLGGLLVMAGGALVLWGRRLPSREVMHLAEARNGIISLGEIISELDIDPAVALKTLKHLQKLGVAIQHWQEYRKNLWEFPDYVRLPIGESVKLAQTRGGRLTLSDLLAAGHSLDIARQTLDTLSEKGLAQRDPASPERGVIIDAVAETA